jgi:hypothetical protein
MLSNDYSRQVSKAICSTSDVLLKRYSTRWKSYKGENGLVREASAPAARRSCRSVGLLKAVSTNLAPNGLFRDFGDTDRLVSWSIANQMGDAGVTNRTRPCQRPPKRVVWSRFTKSSGDPGSYGEVYWPVADADCSPASQEETASPLGVADFANGIWSYSRSGELPLLAPPRSAWRRGPCRR